MNRTTRFLTHDGRTAPLHYWANKMGITKQGLIFRLNGGWTVAEAVTTQKASRVAIEVRRHTSRKISGVTAQAHAKPCSTPIAAHLPFDELQRHHLALQRQFNSTLRQFNRDLHVLMSRGVGLDLSKMRSDRSIPVARVLPKIGNS